METRVGVSLRSVIDAVLRDVVEVSGMFDKVESLLEVSLWDFVTDGVADLVRLDVAVARSTVDSDSAPGAALVAGLALAAASTPAAAAAPPPTLTFLLFLLVCLSPLFSLLLVQTLAPKDLFLHDTVSVPPPPWCPKNLLSVLPIELVTPDAIFLAASVSA